MAGAPAAGGVPAGPGDAAISTAVPQFAQKRISAVTFALHLGHEAIGPFLQLIRISSLLLRIILPRRTDFKLLSLKCRVAVSCRGDGGRGETSGRPASTVGNCMEKSL
jgi:hypothetical protein